MGKVNYKNLNRRAIFKQTAFLKPFEYYAEPKGNPT